MPVRPLRLSVRRLAPWVALWGTVGLAACAPSDGACHLGTVGDLPVLNDTHQPLVRATINDHPVAFIVDSGAEFSTLSRASADRYGAIAQSGDVFMQGAGGATMGGLAKIDKLGLGSATAQDVIFTVVGERLGGTVRGLPVVGLFGDDFMSQYDVVYDLPDHKINLYRVAGCAEGDLPLWPGRAHRIPIRYTTGRTPRIIVKLHLDGHPIDAILDSGAWRTVISTSDAHAAGITDAALRHDPTRNSIGIDDNDNRTYLHRFDTLRIGGDFVLNHPQLAVTDTDQTLLGADFFRTHRVWLSRRQDAMYVQALQEGRLAPDAPR